MPNDTPVDTLIAAAETSLDAGSSLFTAVDTADIAALESSIARILRALAERFGLLPEDHQPILALLPESVDILGTSTKTAAKTHLPVSGVCDLVRSVYESEEPQTPEISEEETDACISAGRLLIDLLSGQRTLTDAVFAKDGAYDTFCGIAAPYLISGSYLRKAGKVPNPTKKKFPTCLQARSDVSLNCLPRF